MFTKQTQSEFIEISHNIEECNNALLKIRDSIKVLDKLGYIIPEDEYVTKLVDIQKLLTQLKDLNNDTYNNIFNHKD